MVESVYLLRGLIPENSRERQYFGHKLSNFNITLQGYGSCLD